MPVVAGKNGTCGQRHVTKAPPKRKTTPPLAPKNSREERKERMREKREQQRLKKMAQSKLGEQNGPHNSTSYHLKESLKISGVAQCCS